MPAAAAASVASTAQRVGAQRQAAPGRLLGAPRRSYAPRRVPSRPAAALQQEPAVAGVPAFIPAEHAEEISEPAAVDMMRRYASVDVKVPSLGTVRTAYVGPASPSPDRPAVVLLHGFDSSSLEFRRFWPLISQVADSYAVDLAGWGFSDAGFGDDADKALGPPQKREHLRAFLQQQVGRPAVLLGASLGGTVAIDFAVSHPELVAGLVLVDAQAFIDGIGPLSSMPGFVARLGVKVLRSVPLRQAANQMAYYNKERYATDDALRVGRLHTHLPGWEDANVAFMRSGGYRVSRRVPEVAAPTLVVWGRNDEILEPSYAEKFLDVLPGARLAWMEECGHCAHLEQPAALLAEVSAFLEEISSSSGVSSVAEN